MIGVSMRASLVGLLLVPSLVFGAGFAKQSIFLSQGSVTEGETVLVHAVVANDDTEAFSGSLLLRDGSEDIGAVPVSLKAGEAAAVSVSWKPSSGKHTIAAELKNKEGVKVEEMSEDFTIKEKPKPAEENSSQSAATIESSDNIQDAIGGVSPAVQGAVAPVFTVIDGGRNTVADVLDGQLATAKVKMGAVASAQDERPEGALPETQGGFWVILWTVYFYILTVLRFLVGNAALFYPVFAIVILFLIFKTFRRFSRG